jgi:hypothetical protein
VLLARRVVVYCGETFCVLDDLLDLILHSSVQLTITVEDSERFSSGQDWIQPILKLAFIYERHRNQAGLPALHVTLSTGLWRRASVAADYVHGLMGLVSQDMRRLIPISYDEIELRDYARIWAIATKVALSESKNAFHLLSYLPSPATDTTLPSWCPNYSGKSSTYNLSPEILAQAGKLWAPDKALSAGIKDELRDDSNGDASRTGNPAYIETADWKDLRLIMANVDKISKVVSIVSHDGSFVTEEDWLNFIDRSWEICPAGSTEAAFCCAWLA